MKRISKTITALLLTAMLAFTGVFAAAADGYVLYAGYTFSLNNRQAVIHSYDGSGELYIPEYIWGYTVTAIEDSAFFGRTDFNSLVLQESAKLTEIGSNAFYGCTGFTRAELPSKVSMLGACAFQNCRGLQTADCGASKLTAIERQTFYGCTALNDVILPETLQEIDDWAFGGCTSLEYVEIPRSVTEIADTAFTGDLSLTLGVWYDSYAFTYAKENNIPYVLLDGVKLGDVDGDGMVTIRDATGIQRYIAMIESLEGVNLYAADVNKDNTVNISDATEIQMYLAHYQLPGAIGEVMTQ